MTTIEKLYMDVRGLSQMEGRIIKQLKWYQIFQRIHAVGAREALQMVESVIVAKYALDRGIDVE